MAAISHQQRLAVSLLYLRGNTYSEIETETGVSHGSISNIIKELLSGQFIIPGVPSDEVSDLHQLSVVLTKNGLEPSQALLGLTFFKKLNELGIELGHLDQWFEMVKIFAPDDFPAEDFFEAALHLHQLEETEDKPFQEVAQEYTTLQQKVGEMGSEVDSLEEKKANLITEMESLTSEANGLREKKDEVKGAFEAQCIELEEIQSKVAENKEEHAQLTGEIGDLLKQKDKLRLEVGSKEDSLIKLKKMGLSEEDLLHLRNLVEGMAEKENISADQVKDEFFSALGQFVTFSGLKKAAQKKAKELEDMANQKASLAGEVAELENRKVILQAEVGKSASAAAEQIREAGEKAVSAIQQEADTIREEMKSILEDTLVASLAVGEMSAMQKKGEEAGKELEKLVEKIQHQLKDGK